MITDLIKRIILEVILRIKRSNIRDNFFLIQPGVSEDEPDSRDRVSSDGITEIPETLSLEPEPHKYVKNQGIWNSCASHAVTSAIELYYRYNKIKIPGYVELSERQHYYYSRIKYQNNFPNNEGMTIRNALKCAKEIGICPEKLCQYISKDMNNAPDNIADGFRLWKIDGYYRLTSIDSIKEWISLGHPVVTGVYMNNSFRELNNTEIKVIKNEPTYGGHAILVYGYDKENLLCLNSWGQSYKDNGIMKVPFKYWEEYSFDTWSFTIQDK